MATIVILEHQMQEGLNQPCLVYVLADYWREAGHTVLIHHGLDDPPPGDLAILHVDMTVIPAEYLDLLARYPRVINGAVRDIGKRTFSTCLLERDSPWTGPVIVKTEMNDSGRPEARLRTRAIRAMQGRIPWSTQLKTYPVHDSVQAVPDSVWNDPNLVVEKFVPERDEHGYYLRIWTFLGDKERSTRYRSDEPVIKSHSRTSYNEQVEVPNEIRLWRAQLGFDYGKFDYVCPNGQPILLDVNRTPSAPRQLAGSAKMLASYGRLSEGLTPFLSKRRLPLPPALA